MQTFDQHLMQLVREGMVAYDVAVAAATRPADFDLQMRTLSGGGEMLSAMSRRGEDEAAASAPNGNLSMSSSFFDP
jgi:Tfp pilus assembly ATPase PilU